MLLPFSALIQAHCFLECSSSPLFILCFVYSMYTVFYQTFGTFWYIWCMLSAHALFLLYCVHLVISLQIAALSLSLPKNTHTYTDTRFLFSHVLNYHKNRFCICSLSPKDQPASNCNRTQLHVHIHTLTHTRIRSRNSLRTIRFDCSSSLRMFVFAWYGSMVVAVLKYSCCCVVPGCV